MTDTILYIVVPCYNEKEVLRETAKRLKEKIYTLSDKNLISKESKILFVNDGSKDNTWEIIKSLHEEDKVFSGVCLSKNRGHQNALLAGLMTAKDYADVVISMDADLQDDINAVDDMIEKYSEGFDIVYGVRSSRKTDTFFKRNTALLFYKMMNLLGAETVYNHADYRLMTKRALEGLAEFEEVNLFLRGLVPMIGYKTTTVEYERAERFAGESKYPFKKMLAFAIDGITSLSIKPITLITRLGLFISCISLFALIYTLIKYFLNQTVLGWSSLMASVWLLGGLQLFAIGIIGEYIGKIYKETKRRPRYIISETLI
ncbi:MAG: glycosyltransferase family 2 protein [Bacteroidales bacterium]|nr:glycosyltransferase family 2 protein [Bacteroidales bacterium]